MNSDKHAEPNLQKQIPFSDRLKQVTSSTHQLLEKRLVTIIRQVRSAEDYIQLLRLFYEYFGGLEDQIDLYVSPDLFSDTFQRRKAKYVLDDIMASGGSCVEKAKSVDLPEVNNHLQAFGALYVIEGSTLGGRIIARMLQKQLHPSGEYGFTFFNGYGENTDRRWASFKTLLNKQATNEAQEKQIIGAANDTFQKFRLWIEKNEY